MKIAKEGILQFLNKSFLKHILDEISVSKEPLIYHYTNIEALYNGVIVHTPEINKEICLRASNCEYMNDPKEIIAGRSFIDRLLKLKLTKEEICDIDNSIKNIYYLISFTSQNDFLPMWSMYGKQGTGITLGFDRQILMQTYNKRFFKCIYTDNYTFAAYKKKLENKIVVENPDSKEEVPQMFVELLTGIIIDVTSLVIASSYLLSLAKDPAYKYEKEIRFIELCDDKTKIKYRHSNNYIIPYIDIFFPKSALREICIGPMLDAKRVKKSLTDFLLINGFNEEDVKIRKSKVPYRG